ncbi:transposase [Rheinheimera sp. MMS21-TC3]|uniref:transposase n=1 Tax=Rheinheimera sp. MMS21-TC3 TaxID=3072790 RepID=UPI0028C37F96|nr:transposase [Rheinheimera sp. MMS21-TC3]WNO60353.1 transposase [Rheinheimera sp. MMS21-TC3]
MARQPRYHISGMAQHVIQRGNNKQVCFFQPDDYRVYLDKVKLYAAQHGVAIHAFVLMTNHVHMQLTPEQETSISLFMQALGRFYVQYVNKAYNRTGTLWEGRYKATLIESDNYFLAVSRYIELNPVRAAMVTHPAAYPWSSFHANALGKAIQLWQPHPCYLALGDTDEQRQQAYRALFEHAFADKVLAEIRYASQKGWVLGSERFKQQIAQQLNRRVSPSRKSPKQDN